VVIMEFELTIEEVETIIDWFFCQQGEIGTTKKDDILGRKLSDHLDKLIEEKKIKDLCDML